jgi:hypothetical protein
MKKLITLFFAGLLLNVCIATAPFTGEIKPLKANEVMIPIGKSGQTISLGDFSKLSPAEYEKLAHVKLGFFDRIAYRKAMRTLKKGIAEDGTITNKKIADLVKPTGDLTEGFHIGGFALGFLVGLIGVLIAYLINDDKKDARVKWAWIGFAAWIVILLIAVVL